MEVAVLTKKFAILVVGRWPLVMTCYQLKGVGERIDNYHTKLPAIGQVCCASVMAGCSMPAV